MRMFHPHDGHISSQLAGKLHLHDKYAPAKKKCDNFIWQYVLRGFSKCIKLMLLTRCFQINEKGIYERDLLDTSIYIFFVSSLPLILA